MISVDSFLSAKKSQSLFENNCLVSMDTFWKHKPGAHSSSIINIRQCFHVFVFLISKICVIAWCNRLIFVGKWLIDFRCLNPSEIFLWYHFQYLCSKLSRICFPWKFPRLFSIIRYANSMENDAIIAYIIIESQWNSLTIVRVRQNDWKGKEIVARFLTKAII